MSGRSKRKAKVLEENYWECSLCTYRNSVSAFKCRVCDVRKGTSTRKPRMNPQLAAQQYSGAPPAKTSKTENGQKEKTDKKPAQQSEPEKKSWSPYKKIIKPRGMTAKKGLKAKSMRRTADNKIKMKWKIVNSEQKIPETTPRITKVNSKRPRLTNVDRSSGETQEITVNNITVLITEYQPTSKSSNDAAETASTCSTSSDSQSDSSGDRHSTDRESSSS